MMKLFKRNFYLDKLINKMSMPDIKVITGVRCVGKSKLLDEFKVYIINYIDNYNSKKLNFLFIGEV